MEFLLTATCAFGIEAIVADELRQLGYEDLRVENGKIHFKGNENDIAQCNIWLRTADRILINLKEFHAETYDELFDNTFEIDWGEFIPEDGKVHVNGKSIKSTLFSVPDCQSIVKKAIVEKLKLKYKTKWFEEDGAVFKTEISLLKNKATISIDTSGYSLHKRGYRTDAGTAPLKETLAAALVILSKWEPSRILADPFCGSGTIPIEAALIAKNIAPGLNRNFSAEDWPFISSKIWKNIRSSAKECIKNDLEFRILGSDIDGKVLKKARENAINAGVDDFVAFQKLSFSEFSSRKKYGCMIMNPPYGERIGEEKKVEELYKEIGYKAEELDTWTFFTLTSNEEFETLFGKRANRKRKLYNGKIKCNLYQHFGPLPDKRRNTMD